MSDAADKTLARVCYEAHRALMVSEGDHTLPNWDLISDWLRAQYVEAVRVASDESAGPVEVWRAWRDARVAEGWKHGPLWAPDRREDPSLVDSWQQVPAHWRVMDVLTIAIVRALRPSQRWPQSPLHVPFGVTPVELNKPAAVLTPIADATKKLKNKKPKE